MLFNSIAYLLLFFLTYTLYWNVGQKSKKIILLISSLVFYGYFHLGFLFHFLFSIGINFYFSNRLWDLKKQNTSTKNTLILIITFNLLNLGFFKYTYFLLDLAFRITGYSALPQIAVSMNIFLPLAISFYTFQLMAIQIDIHRGLSTDKIDVFDYFLFILFFPQLIAGPIMRLTDFLPQINFPKINKEIMMSGILFIILGLFKKVVIADTIAPIVFPVFQEPNAFNSISLYISMLGFGVQLYCDFSGYTDIARGSAKLLGYEIPENFRGPFLANSFTAIWGRWHITLSTWLRDYLYISLGGNKKGFFFSQVNLFFTMCLGGLWHGASLNYLAWGAYLGSVQIFERTFDKLKLNIFPNKKFFQALKLVLVFHLFFGSGIFFRTGSSINNGFSNALNYYQRLVSFESGQLMSRYVEIIFAIILTLVLNYWQFSDYTKLNKLKKTSTILIPVFGLIMLLLLGVMGEAGGNFVYFQF